MKKFRTIALLFSIPSLIFLYGCNKEFREQATGQNNSIGMPALKVSADFNWTTTRNVMVRIPTYIKGVVKITSCDGKIIYYKGLHPEGKEFNVTISVPNYITQLAVNSNQFTVHEGICGPSLQKSADALSVTFGSPFTFNASGTRCPFSVALDNDRFVVTYAKGDFMPCYLRVGTKSGSNITYGPEFMIPGSDRAYYATQNQLIKIGTDKILVIFKAGSGGYVSHVTVSGNSFSVNSTISAGRLINYPSLAQLNSSQFIFAYDDESGHAGYARLCMISGTTITAGPEVTVPHASYGMTVTRIDDSRALLAYKDRSSTAVRACVGQFDGINLNIYPDFAIDPDDSHNPSVAMLDGSHFAVAYIDDAIGHYGSIRVGSVSATYLAFGPRVMINNLYTEEMFVYSRDASNILVMYNDDPGTGYICKYAAGEIAGTSVTFSPASVLTNNYGVHPSVCNFGTDNLLATIRNQAPGIPGDCFLSVPLIPDTDGDGVSDPDDDYPSDPTRAFNNYFPAAGFGTLAFEDLWPGKGDYDFNDVVVNYRFQTITNAANKVVEIFARFSLKANGATLDNGFGFNLPDCNPALSGILTVTGYHLSRGYISLNVNGNENGQAKPTLIVWDNTSDLMPDLTNTILGQPYIDPIDLTLKLTTPGHLFDASAFSLTSFNPFIIIGMERGKEVHLPNRPPTSLANPALFGILDDNSNPAQDRYYKTITNLPWAIDIPEPFAWPVEKADITGAHQKFAAWAESGGIVFGDWYQDKPGYRYNPLIYTH